MGNEQWFLVWKNLNWDLQRKKKGDRFLIVCVKRVLKLPFGKKRNKTEEEKKERKHSKCCTVLIRCRKGVNNSPLKPARSVGCHLDSGFFFGNAGRLACHKWLWIVTASTLADMVLAGITVNCFLSELYL